MHILLCNERFLFRYGVDRVLLILANYLRAQGDTVSIMGLNIDMNIAESVADHVIRIPMGDDYYNLNEYVSQWLEQNWEKAFLQTGNPDLIVNCGWPFFVAIPFMQKHSRGVIFHDYGIVPVYQYVDGQLRIQEKLRYLRKNYIPQVSYVITISDYITQTSDEIQPFDNIPVQTVHLGLNHMEMNLWDDSKAAITSEDKSIKKLLAGLHAEGKKVILTLGRWENTGYKNSTIMFDLLRCLRQRNVDAVILGLSKPGNFSVPSDLQDYAFPLGFVSDEALVFLMQNVDLGVVPTLWEGFDLPLGEMQYYHGKVLVFNVGAHPEVVLHPWYLCNNLSEMVEKAIICLNKRDLNEQIISHAYKRFVEYFTWDRCTAKIYEVFNKILAGTMAYGWHDDFINNAYKGDTIIIDMSNPSRDPANPGIIRVCRRLASSMQYYTDPVFVIWSEPDKAYVMPTLHEYQVMGIYNGPVLFDEMRLSPDDYRIKLTDYLRYHTPRQRIWLFLPDIIFQQHGEDVYRYARSNGFLLADIFYDDIPYKLKDIYSQERQDAHANYMIRLADSVFVSADSQYAAECLKDFLAKNGIAKANIITLELPGELGGVERTKEATLPQGKTVQFVCVSTLEPRKNHLTLIDACLMLEEEYPELDFKLVLIGNKYPDHFYIAEYAERASVSSRHIAYLGIVSDEVMQEEISKSSFTCYLSKMEGYGMPIMESVWQGKPCLCHNEGSMAELAKGGGCLTVDVNDVKAVKNAIYRLCTDRELLQQLTKEAVGRKIITWDEYTRNTLRTFVLEGSKYFGQSHPDFKYTEPGLMPESSLLSLYIEHLLDRKKIDVAITYGIEQPETLISIDKKVGLTVSLGINIFVVPQSCRNLIVYDDCSADILTNVINQIKHHRHFGRRFRTALLIAKETDLSAFDLKHIYIDMIISLGSSQHEFCAEYIKYESSPLGQVFYPSVFQSCNGDQYTENN